MTEALTEEQQINASIKLKIDELSKALQERAPGMPGLLRDIWKTVRQYPEQVTLLDPEEINKIVEGLKVQTNTTFAEKVTKESKSSTGTKSLKAQIASKGVDAF